MKKFLVLILVLCIFGSALANNEVFQLRNDILFGDTLEIVKQKETLPIQSGSADSTNDVWFTGTIAGMDGRVCYSFNEETGGLTDMHYEFSTSSGKESNDNTYKKLSDGLIRKYGEPLNNPDGSLYIITGKAFEHVSILMAVLRMLSGRGDILDYDEWIVDCEGYHVKIDLVSYYGWTSSTGNIYYSSVSYHYYTDEEVMDELQKKTDENAAIDNDL